jgi:hypothetical protein
MRIWILMTITLLWSWPLWGDCQAAETSQAQPATQSPAISSNAVIGQPAAFFPEPTHTFKQVLEGATVMHSFVLQNRGDAPLDVKEVKTS